MNKEMLADAIAATMDIKRDDAKKFLDTLAGVIMENVKHRKEINLSPLGKFKVADRPARKCRNPQTGEEMDIPACKVVRFVPGKALRDAANQ